LLDHRSEIDLFHVCLLVSFDGTVAHES